jgi:ADP-ribosylglycohydrolase
LACRLAASLGGDCDTIAAIAGSIAGACHGAERFPGRVVEALHAANPDLAIEDLADQLLALRSTMANAASAPRTGERRP